MPARRSRGEGALYWDESRQRWMASVDVGFSPTGKRQRRWVTGKTKTEAKQKLLALRRDQSDGLPTEHRTYTVREAVESWLEHGLTGRDEHTVTNRTILARTHVIPALGSRRLVDLTAEEIDAWLAAKSETLSTDTLHRLLSILRRSIRRAQARELVRRNVALLCEAPRGTKGRPSKSLTLQQAMNLLAAAEGTSMNAYIVLALLIGARTEELRALTWDRLDLDGDPPTIQVWRSVRRDGRMKTAKSRRTLELPDRCVEALRDHKAEQMRMRQEAGDSWNELGLVFCTRHGSALDAANVRRSFRLVASAAGLNPQEWTPRELRHSFVSLLSSAPSHHTWGARNQRALRWRRQALGRQFGRQVNRCKRQTRVLGSAKGVLTRDVTGGRYWI
jgi:site-specific recombinase XerD